MRRLVLHAVLASKDAPNDLGYRLMLPWRLRICGSCVVCGRNIHKWVERIPLADDFEVSQRKEERLADTKGSHALGIMDDCVFSHLVVLIDREPIASHPLPGLIQFRP